MGTPIHAVPSRRDVRKPVDHESEAYLLGVRLLGECADPVSAEDFDHVGNRIVADEISKLERAGVAVGLPSVAASLRDSGADARLRQWGGIDYLTELIGKVVTTQSGSYLAARVKALASRRRIASAAARWVESASTDDDSGELIARIRAELDALATTIGSRGDAFGTLQIGSVPDVGAVRWLVHGLWVDQACGVIGAEPKSYKSFLAMHLAVCIASGKPVLGKHETSKGRVLVFNAEDRPHMTRRRIARMCTALETDIASLDLKIIDVSALRIDDPKTVEKIRATVDRERPVLLILDPLRDLHGLDENDAQIVSALLAPLRLLQRDFGCSVMLVHHLAKAQPDSQRRPGQRLRGSSALHGWLDSALYLTRQADDRVNVQVEHREAGAPEAFAFQLRELATERGEALWLDLAESGTASMSADSDAAKVLEILRRSSEPMSMRAIRTAFGAHSRADAAVKTLAQANHIEQVEFDREDSSGRVQKLKGWRAREEAFHA